MDGERFIARTVNRAALGSEIRAYEPDPDAPSVARIVSLLRESYKTIEGADLMLEDHDAANLLIDLDALIARLDGGET